ncbi:unnamed protein product [Didymodactylos carnosus]|uniref:Purple acid phosphatase n=1 Tax=Didymodactylos carnosus TaxID=1234261 RepID=A0A814PZQ9_9BILA|nr:unnamed protein product [Didymodactylos carnosus]CAF1112590.1 unnamed protein product [Didymodactylos carnosus]CAF3764073.1 unnamed protein product [Didymodactylos carnosus]CAF3876780.1 unnamed protein product [Didymodactylos carnosus]
MNMIILVLLSLPLIVSGLFGTSLSVCVKDNQPTQIRLAFIPNGMTVSWTTSSNANSPTSVVKYGLSKTNLNKQASGYVTTYGTSNFHNVLLKGLTPNTIYYYQIAASGTVGTSGKYSFKTAPEPSNGQFTVTILGDWGSTQIVPLIKTPKGPMCTCSGDTLKALKKKLSSTDFFWHLGDAAYADDFYLNNHDFSSLLHHPYEGLLDNFQCTLQPLSSTKSYMILPGNHEVKCNEIPIIDDHCPKPTTNFSTFLDRYRMPGIESGGFSNLWYSFDYGLVHFAIINTETDFPSSPSGPGTSLDGGNFISNTAQLKWLENDLKKANNRRAQIPWIIVGGHRPFYSSSPDSICEACKTAFEPILIKYKVDMYFSGHAHWYERIYPIKNGKFNKNSNSYTHPTGIIHLTTGAAGNPECSESQHSPASYSANISYQCSFGQLRINSRTNAKWTVFDTTASNKIIDEININIKH